MWSVGEGSGELSLVKVELEGLDRGIEQQMGLVVGGLNSLEGENIHSIYVVSFRSETKQGM